MSDPRRRPHVATTAADDQEDVSSPNLPPQRNTYTNPVCLAVLLTSMAIGGRHAARAAGSETIVGLGGTLEVGLRLARGDATLLGFVDLEGAVCYLAARVGIDLELT